MPTSARCKLRIYLLGLGLLISIFVMKGVCTRCENSKYQECQSTSDSNSFHSHVTRKEHTINFSFNCRSSNVVYLFHCVVCGFQYVGSTGTPFRLTRTIVGFGLGLRYMYKNKINQYIYVHRYTVYL